MKKRLWLLVSVLVLASCGGNGASSSSTSSSSTSSSQSSSFSSGHRLDKDLAILYTNDIHCQVGDEKTAGYSELASYKKALLDDNNYVALVDSGDAIQGGPIGTLSKGLYITDIMNEVGYDVAIPGNHEFDYGMDNFLNSIAKSASFPYVCSNFMDLKTNKTVFEPYVIKNFDDVKVAFLGITTPKTITSSSPKYFQDDEGNYIYGFSQDSKETFYSTIQSSVDSAIEEGADYVVALSHLGIGEEASPYMSTEVIANTSGIDVMLDGHSHSLVECQRVKNKKGEITLLSQTGTQFQSFGLLYITKEGNISTGLIKDYANKDDSVSAYIDSIKAQYDEKLKTVVAHTDYDLVILDPTTEKRIVRTKETNIGDLAADAFRAYTGADISIVNSGGLRKNIATGDVTYGDIINAMPFNNSVCMKSVSGKIIKEALEMSVHSLPAEYGGFMQVSGMSFKFDSSIATPIVLDKDDIFVSMSGEGRVSEIMVGGVALDETKTYKLASTSYTLKSSGDGYSMFNDSPILFDEDIKDNQALIDYIQKNLEGTITGDAYSNPYGTNRIVDVTPEA